MTEALRLAGDKLMHIHLADSNRQAPGIGHIDFYDVVRTLNSMHYQGFFAVDSVPVKPDWKSLLRDSITFMKQVEQTVALQERIDSEMRTQAAIGSAGAAATKGLHSDHEEENQAR